MTRHQMREVAFILTFEKIFSNETTQQLIETAKECNDFEINQEAICLFENVDQKKDELDEIIKKYLKKWTIDRISKVALAVLRIAVYEMYYVEDINDDIVISEAVKIVQTYTLKDDVTFVNGLLASISRERTK